MRGIKHGPKKQRKELPGEAWHLLARHSDKPDETLVAGGRAGDRLVLDELVMLRPAIRIEQLSNITWFVSIGGTNAFWVMYNKRTGETVITHEERA